MSGKEHIDLTEAVLCLCHLDLSPRNFLLDKSKPLWLVDSASAGVCPRAFDLWSIDFGRYTMATHFTNELVQVPSPSVPEMQLATKLYLGYQAFLRYSRSIILSMARTS